MTVSLVEKYRPAVINNESGEVTWLTPSRKYEDKWKAVDHMETAIDLAHHPPDEWEDFYQCPKSMFEALQDLEYSRNRSQLTVVLMTVYDEEFDRTTDEFVSMVENEMEEVREEDDEGVEDDDESFDHEVSIFRDGNEVCALIGENLEDGVAGFGETRPQALRDLADRIDGSGSDVENEKETRP